MRSHVSPLLSRSQFLRRMAFQSVVGLGVIAGSLAIGAAGFHVYLGLDWLEATLNASMILTGMGPIAPFSTPAAKLFGIAYSLFSGVAFLTIAAVLMGPVVHRFLHRFHLDLYEDDAGREQGE